MDSSESKGSEEISESKGSEKTSKSKEREEMSQIMKTMEIHLIVATLIATVSFAAGFTLPGGYIQNEGINQGRAALSLPTNATKGKDGDTTNEMRKYFRRFIIADYIAIIFSSVPIIFYCLAALPFIKKEILSLFFALGFTFTIIAMYAMVGAFGAGLRTVIDDSSLLNDAEKITGVLMALLILFITPLIYFKAKIQDFVRKKFVYIVMFCYSRC